jgi:hypothetical protein
MEADQQWNPCTSGLTKMTRARSSPASYGIVVSGALQRVTAPSRTYSEASTHLASLHKFARKRLTIQIFFLRLIPLLLPLGYAELALLLSPQ